MFRSQGFSDISIVTLANMAWGALGRVVCLAVVVGVSLSLGTLGCSRSVQSSSSGSTEDISDPAAVVTPATQSEFPDTGKRRDITVDLEITRPGEKKLASFEIENDSDETWQVADLFTTCGCAVLSHDWDSISPGECKEIQLEFTAPTSEGLVAKQLAVTFHQTSAPKVWAKLVANVLSPVSIHPRELEFICKNKVAIKHDIVTVTNTSGVDWLAIRADAKPDELQFDINPRPSTTAGIQVYEMTVRCDPGRYRSTDTRETVRLYATFKESNQEQEVEVGFLPVRISVRDAIEVLPDTIFLGKVTPSHTLKRQLLVAFNEEEPKDWSSPDFFKLEASSGDLSTKLLSMTARQNGLLVVDVEFVLASKAVQQDISVTLKCAEYGFTSRPIPVIFSLGTSGVSNE